MGAGDSFFPGGPLDETAHFLTMLFILWALGDQFLVPRIAVPALVATVLIDADHIPGYLGDDFLTAGTPRPYTHSLLTLAVVRGIAVHLWRDLSESSGGVSIFATPRPSVSSRIAGGRRASTRRARRRPRANHETTWCVCRMSRAPPAVSLMLSRRSRVRT